jgi:predicted  nucleic acid-binding Zn-ribbon protein
MSVDEKLKEQSLDALEKEYKSKQKEMKAAEKNEKKLEEDLEELKAQYRDTKDDIKNVRPYQIFLKWSTSTSRADSVRSLLPVSVRKLSARFSKKSISHLRSKS